MVFLRFSAVKGGDPVSMSYINAPKDHQSTAFPCPLLVKISGAMYSIVPQNLLLWKKSIIIQFWWTFENIRPLSFHVSSKKISTYVCVTDVSSIDSLQSPKSVSFTCPLASNNIFSGFKSRYIIP